MVYSPLSLISLLWALRRVGIVPNSKGLFFLQTSPSCVARDCLQGGTKSMANHCTMFSLSPKFSHQQNMNSNTNANILMPRPVAYSCPKNDTASDTCHDTNPTGWTLGHLGSHLFFTFMSYLSQYTQSCLYKLGTGYGC